MGLNVRVEGAMPSYQAPSKVQGVNFNTGRRCMNSLYLMRSTWSNQNGHVMKRQYSRLLVTLTLTVRLARPMASNVTEGKQFKSKR